jgi:signal transduction histidine kinase/DNA-binding response OmpR family regulator/Tfp pilus assembly protein PilF
MKSVILITILLLIHELFTYGQNLPDSLQLQLENAPNDTIRARTLIIISDYLSPNNPQQALDYLNQALELSLKVKNNLGIATSYSRMGALYQLSGQYSKAIDCFSSSIRLFEKLGNEYGLGSCYNAFGWLWYEIRDYEKASKYFKLSLEIFKKLGNETAIASLYLNYGSVLDFMEQYDSAFFYITEAKNIFEKLNDSALIVDSYMNYGNHFEILGKHDTALLFYSESLNICKKLGFKDRIADSYINMGNIYNLLGEYENAVLFFDSAMNIAEEIKSPDKIMNNAEGLSTAYKNLGNYEAAYRYKNIYDSLLERTGQSEKQLAQMEFNREREFETRLQEKELQKQKLIRNFSLIAFLLMIFLAAALYRNFRIKKKTNQLLSEIDELKSRMFSNISHEFRTPLTLILGPLDEMIEEGESKKTSPKTLKMMQRNASRLLTLVNQMLDLSKMDAGKLKLELVENDIIQALRVMVLSFSSLAEQKHIKFEYEMPDQPCTTWFDPDKLEKIINNLLSNAFKFTPENGIVKVVARLITDNKITPLPPSSHENPVLELTVEDTGKGIPKEHLDKVFDRFHQVEGTSEIEQIGTGIGLALTKELLNLMHGKVTVESTSGKGSVFKIILPLGKNHLKEKEYTLMETTGTIKPGKIKVQEELLTSQGTETPLTPQQEMDIYTEGKEDLPLILIVDDHPDIRVHIRQKLKNFRVMEASDGVGGLDISVEHLPDLIVTDLMMPNMDGVELCKKLKTDERTSHIPVIMLTAKASVENRIEGFETGADDYITKPFNMKELLIRINNLIEQRRKLRERFSREVTLQPKDIALTSADEKFLNRTIEIIEKNMGDGEFDVAALREDVGLSHMQLFRKLKALTDQAPGDFIRTIRLKRAAQLMQQKFGNIAEITYEVGFNNLSYFAKCFREMFGMSPSDYMKNN